MQTTELTFRHYDDTDTFDRLYVKNLQKASSNTEAYRMTEEAFKKRFGKRKYSSPESFKVAYHRRHSSN